MKALKVILIGTLISLLAGCAVVPSNYGYQSAYYVRPVYVQQPYYVAVWHHEHHHHGYY